MILRRLSERLGLAEGGALRAAVGRMLGWQRGTSTAPHGGADFTAAVVALAAKMAQADGVVVAAEREMFRRMFPVEPEAEAGVLRLFEIARQDVAGYESYARRIAGILAGSPLLKRNVLESLFHIAAADGVLHPGEETYLRDVAEIFAITPTEFRAIRSMFVRDIDDPYVVLGVPHDISNRALKATYKRLVRENHPDAHTARGVPAEFIEIATRKLAAINAAYDTIAKERGL